jgi:hypothetical protein
MKTALRLGDPSPVLAFTVHEPPNPPADRVERAERLVFVKDGFSFAALLFGPLWLLFNRMWAALLAYLVVALALGTLLELLKVPSVWASLTGIALNLIVALEADSIRRWTLGRRGWQLIGSVVGRSTAECERRFFETWLPAQPVLRQGASASGAFPATTSHAAAGSGTSPGFIPAGPAASGHRRWRLFGGQN